MIGGLAALLSACGARSGPVGGASPESAAVQAAAPQPLGDASAGHTFSNPKLGIALTWPGGWAKKDSKDFELLLVPDGKGPEGAELSLDIPDLPVHVPGMIPIGMVKDGYIDDLKKSHGQVTIQEESPKVDGAKARKVHATWKKDGKEYQETALLLVHSDRVYILRSDSAMDDEPAVKAAYDEFVKSIKWVKK
jgi:hypothetical protein